MVLTILNVYRNNNGKIPLELCAEFVKFDQLYGWPEPWGERLAAEDRGAEEDVTLDCAEWY